MGPQLLYSKDLFDFFTYVCECIMCLYLHTLCMVPVKARREHADPLGLQLQVAVSHLMWVLGREFGSSARAATLSHVHGSIICHYLSYYLS